MINKALQEELKTIASETGFHDANQVLLDAAIDCCYIYNDPSKKISVGISRIGGTPDLPECMDWPKSEVHDEHYDVQHLLFLAQLNLKDIPNIDDLALPKYGMIWLFFHYGLGSAISPLVVYAPDPQNIRPREKPTELLPIQKRLKPMPIRFVHGISLPLSSQSFRNALEPFEDAGGDIFELENAIRGESKGQVGGFSTSEEEDPYRNIAFRALQHADCIDTGIYTSVHEIDSEIKAIELVNTTKHQDSRISQLRELKLRLEWIEKHQKEIKTEYSLWRLLFRFARNSEAGLDLGDASSLDTFVRITDLQRQVFENLLGHSTLY